MTASSDAIHASDCEDAIHWLQPQGAPAPAADQGRPRDAFRHMTASLGLGALLTLGNPGAAIAPALASPSEPIEVPVPQAAPIEVTRSEPVVPLPVQSDIVLAAVQPVDLPLVALAEVQPAAPGPVVAVDEATCRTGLGVTLADVLAGIVADPTPIRVALNSVSLSDAGIHLAASAGAPVEASVVRDAAAVQGQEAALAITPATELQAAAAQVEPDANRDPQELLDFDGMRVPRWIVETILRASDVTGVDPVYMMALADKESSFIPANKASTSSAEGLFQFISSTWLEVVKSFGAKHGLAMEAAAIKKKGNQLTIQDETMREHVFGLRRDPYLSALMAAEMMKRDRAKVERRLGRPITRSEFYLSHFFGVDSASRFMALFEDKPKQSAPRSFPAAARANKTLFFAKAGRKTRQLTVAEVYGRIDTMIDKRLNRYEDVTNVVEARF
jgi:hypothetical protein